MSLHVFVRFEPIPGKELEFRQAVLSNVGPSRAEPGCLSLHVFESIRDSHWFEIHSEWVDEAAFELHAQLPHTVTFLKKAEMLLTHEVKGLRTRQIA
jgi:quinol monooxygenase YgiN